MPVLIALFRGINVGGKNRLPMKSLVALLEGLGASDVRTYIQSGNAVFRWPRRSTRGLADAIGRRVLEEHGFEPKVWLLEREQLQAIAAKPGFPTEDGKALHVWFLDGAPPQPDLAKLDALRAPSERFRLDGEAFLLHAPEGVGRSKLAAAVEKALGVPATARNWNTVALLLEMR